MDELTPLRRETNKSAFGSVDDGTAVNESVENGGGRGCLMWKPLLAPGDGDGDGDHHHHHHHMDMRVVEIALESLDEISETIVHAIEDVRHEIHEVLEEPVAVPVKPREEGHHSQKLGAVALATLVFYKVSGGPFGCEPAVKAAGAFYALMGYALFPIVWCLPEIMVTAELGSAFPEPSGPVAWVEEAFGPELSLFAGYFRWISGATDNAIYPALFLRYVTSGSSIDTVTRFLFTVIMTIVLAGINYSGLEIVGNLSIIVCAISMSPFIIMAVLAIPKLEVHRWLQTPVGDLVNFNPDGAGLLPAPVWAGIMWRPFLNILFWNLNQFDVGGTFAGELRDPNKVFAPAMFLSGLFVWLGYLIPLLAALGAADAPQSDWEPGHLTQAATDIGGEWLGMWTIFASAISNIAQFEAEMSGDAYQLLGMADRGLIPKVFAQRSRFGTPTNGILLGTFVIVAVSVADFDQLVEMLNFAVAISMLLEFGAFIKLRITDDDVERPYRIPLGTFGCIVLVLPSILFIIYLLLIASLETFLYFLVLIFFGVVFYVFQKFAKHYGWIEYVEAPKRQRVIAKSGASFGTDKDPATTAV